MSKINSTQRSGDEQPLHMPRKPASRGVARFLPGWLILGLGLSLLAHVGLYYAFQLTPLNELSPDFYKEDEPPRFRVGQAPETVSYAESDVAPVDLFETAAAERRELESPDPLKPDLREALQETDVPNRDVRMAPSDEDLTPEFLQVEDREALSASTLRELRQRLDERSSGEPETGESLVDLNDRVSPDQPSVDIGSLTERGEGGRSDLDAFEQGQGYSDIDDLLAESGTLAPDTAPLLMSGDVLFPFDSAQLDPRSYPSLSKVAELAKKQPKLNFVVEGYTDSFGTDEYNLALSKQRADSVAQILVQRFGLDPRRIKTIGYGERRPLVPQTASREAQARNRRVEILLKMPQG